MALPTLEVRMSRHHPSRLENQARLGWLGPFCAADLAGELVLGAPRGSGRGVAGVKEHSGPGSHWAICGRQAQGRALPWGAGRGPRSQATPPQRRQWPEAQSLPRRVSELLWVALPEGRGSSASTPRPLAFREQGGGDTPGRRLRAAEITAEYRHRVTDRRAGRKRRLGWGVSPRAAGTEGLSVCSAGAPKSGAAKVPALPAPARNSRPHFPLLPAPSLQWGAECGRRGGRGGGGENSQLFKILLEQFLIPPLRRGSEGGGGKESGRREESCEGRREGTQEGGKEGGDCRLGCSRRRALRKAGGRGTPVSLARCLGEGGGALAWSGQWWGWLRGSPWGRGCSRGGCDGLTGAWQWELLSAQACTAKARVTAAPSRPTARPGRSKCLRFSPTSACTRAHTHARTRALSWRHTDTQTLSAWGEPGMGWPGEGYASWGHGVRGAAVSLEVLSQGGGRGGCRWEGGSVLGGGGSAGGEERNLFGWLREITQGFISPQSNFRASVRGCGDPESSRGSRGGWEGAAACRRRSWVFRGVGWGLQDWARGTAAGARAPGLCAGRGEGGGAGCAAGGSQAWSGRAGPRRARGDALGARRACAGVGRVGVGTFSSQRRDAALPAPCTSRGGDGGRQGCRWSLGVWEGPSSWGGKVCWWGAGSAGAGWRFCLLQPTQSCGSGGWRTFWGRLAAF